MPSPVTYAGPLAVTLAYVLLYYVFQIYGTKVKTSLAKEYAARGEKFDRYYTQDRRMLAADRIQLNTLEHMPPFLTLLWLNAVFVGTGGATVAGALYVAARAVYPFLMGGRLGRAIRPRIFLSTMVGYLVILWYCATLAWGMFGG